MSENGIWLTIWPSVYDILALKLYNFYNFQVYNCFAIQILLF